MGLVSYLAGYLLIGTGLMSATIDYNYAIGNDIFALSPPSSWAVVLIYEWRTGLFFLL